MEKKRKWKKEEMESEEISISPPLLLHILSLSPFPLSLHFLILFPFPRSLATRLPQVVTAWRYCIIIWSRPQQSLPECDVPVPGIVHFFAGIRTNWYRKKSWNRYRTNLVPGKSLGNGFGKYLVPEKSLETGIGQIWYRNWFSSLKFRNFEDL